MRVDPRLCEAHALCIDLARMSSTSGRHRRRDESPDVTGTTTYAIAACPRQAISWVEQQPGHPTSAEGRDE